jgi:hypothetical protein
LIIVYTKGIYVSQFLKGNLLLTDGKYKTISEISIFSGQLHESSKKLSIPLAMMTISRLAGACNHAL